MAFPEKVSVPKYQIHLPPHLMVSSHTESMQTHHPLPGTASASVFWHSDEPSLLLPFSGSP